MKDGVNATPLPPFNSTGYIDLAFFFSSRRRHTRCGRDWSSDVCSSDLNTTQLRGFLGLAQYYRQYVKDYMDVAGLLYDMLKDDAPEYWGPAQQAAFDNLKEKLTSEPIRAHPNFDKSFKLYTDASDTGLGAVLAQDDEEGKERVIAFEARRLNSAERV